MPSETGDERSAHNNMAIIFNYYQSNKNAKFINKDGAQINSTVSTLIAYSYNKQKETTGEYACRQGVLL